MNRRQKIIVSVTGIFLVLLLLVGLTYAYFLTNITGNNKDKSISVSTANLAVVYGGDDSSIIGEGEKIIPGKTFAPKTFTVTNQGNATTDYVVVIEILEGTSTFESNDFTYTLTCESGCDGVDTATTFPINGGILVGNNIDVGETQTYSFTLTYEETGKNQTNDMNKKLEARINIKDISSINPYSGNTSSLAYNIVNNAIAGKTGTTLAGTPLSDVANSISKYGTGKFSYETKTTDSLCSGTDPWLVGDSATAAQSGSTVSSYEDAVGKYVYDQCDRWTKYLESYDASTSTLTFKNKEILDEKTLSVTQDDLGVSYYYRGAVEDNYVEFNNMCWRIVRIEGDGSIKITLAAQKKCSEITSGDTGTAFIGTGHYGHNKGIVTNSLGQQSSDDKYVADYLTSPTNNTTSMKYKLDEWYNTNLKSVEGKLKKDTWCLGNTKDAYDQSTNALLTSSVNDLMYNSKSFNYDTLRRLNGISDKYATLRCNGKNYDSHESYIGALTVDEVVFAGGKVSTTYQNYYLTDNATANWWQTLSPANFNYNFDYAFFVRGDGYVGSGGIVSDDDGGLRPAVSLASSTVITKGDGTIGNPYIVG